MLLIAWVNPSVSLLKSRHAYAFRHKAHSGRKHMSSTHSAIDVATHAGKIVMTLIEPLSASAIDSLNLREQHAHCLPPSVQTARWLTSQLQNPLSNQKSTYAPQHCGSYFGAAVNTETFSFATSGAGHIQSTVHSRHLYRLQQQYNGMIQAHGEPKRTQ